MIFIIGLACTILIGWLFISLLRLKLSRLETMGTSFILGSGLHSLIYFTLLFLLNHTSSTLFWLSLLSPSIVLLIVHIIRRQPLNLRPGKISPRFDLLTCIPWVIILLLFLVTYIYASRTPIYTTDSIHLYDFRAKVIYESQMLSPIKDYVSVWYSYPPYTSLVNLSMRYFGLGEHPGIYYSILYLAFSLPFYSYLRSRTRPRLAAIGTLAFYSTPLTLWQARLDGQTNLPYTIFYSLSIIYLLCASEGEKLKTNYLMLSAMFLGLATWTRSVEPVWIIPLVWATFVAWKYRDWTKLFAYVYISQIPQQLWLRFITFHDKTYLIDRFRVVIAKYITFPQTKIEPIGETISVPEISNAASLPVNISVPTISLLSRLVTVSRFFVVSIGQGLAPAFYLLPVCVIFDVLTNKFWRYLPLLMLTGSLLILLWAGTLFTSLSPDFSDYWMILDNALIRLSGVMLPSMWLIIFQSSLWDYLPFTGQDS